MSELDKNSIIGITALLVHAAKIDEIYSEHEKDLIKVFIRSYLKNEEANQVLKLAEQTEKDSNQLLNFRNFKNRISVKKILLNIYGKLLFQIIQLINTVNLSEEFVGIYFPDKKWRNKLKLLNKK